MRKTIQRENFGDENEIPVGLGYIKDIEKEPETEKTKRQRLKVENDSLVKSDEVKTEKVKSKKSSTRSNKVKLEEIPNENECDGTSSSEDKKPNSYKRQETKKKNRKMSSVDFSDSDTEVENKETVIFQGFIPTKIDYQLDFSKINKPLSNREKVRLEYQYSQRLGT